MVELWNKMIENYFKKEAKKEIKRREEDPTNTLLKESKSSRSDLIPEET